MIFGLVNYDIAKQYGKKDGKETHRRASAKVPQGMLKFGWLRAGSLSSYMGDYSTRDRIQDLLARNLTDPKDVYLPIIRIHEDDAKEAKHWVRQAQFEFFKEVIPRLRKRVDKLMAALQKGTLGIGDVGERLDVSIKNAEKRVEDVMVALSTFRLTADFEQYVTAFKESAEVLKDEVFVELCKLARKTEEKEKVSA